MNITSINKPASNQTNVNLASPAPKSHISTTSVGTSTTVFTTGCRTDQPIQEVKYPNYPETSTSTTKNISGYPVSAVSSNVSVPSSRTPTDQITGPLDDSGLPVTTQPPEQPTKILSVTSGAQPLSK